VCPKSGKREAKRREQGRKLGMASADLEADEAGVPHLGRLVNQEN
jgi:hypothetical protein